MIRRATFRSAFTLIELLVVIAIIAILAAILFPVFAQAKLAAKKSVDLSNMKQQGLAIIMYANDFDDTPCQASWEFKGLDLGQPTNPTGKYQVHFTYLLQPYIKNYAIFIAPADSTPDQQRPDVLRLAVSKQLHSGIQRYSGSRLASCPLYDVPEPSQHDCDGGSTISVDSSKQPYDFQW